MSGSPAAARGAPRRGCRRARRSGSDEKAVHRAVGVRAEVELHAVGVDVVGLVVEAERRRVRRAARIASAFTTSTREVEPVLVPVRRGRSRRTPRGRRTAPRCGGTGPRSRASSGSPSVEAVERSRRAPAASGRASAAPSRGAGRFVIDQRLAAGDGRAAEPAELARLPAALGHLPPFGACGRGGPRRRSVSTSIRSPLDGDRRGRRAAPRVHSSTVTMRTPRPRARTSRKNARPRARRAARAP